MAEGRGRRVGLALAGRRAEAAAEPRLRLRLRLEPAEQAGVRELPGTLILPGP